MGKERFEKETSRDSKRKPIPPKKIYFVYQTVAQIISKALNQEGTLRGLVYEHAKTLVKTHLRLAIEVARHRSLLDRLLTETGLAEKEHLEPDLAQVLVYELVLGQCKQLPEGFDVFDRVGAHKQHLQKALRKIQRSGDLQNLVIDKPEARVPRYGRVNTLVASLESVVENLQRRGFTLVDTEGKSYQEFLDCVRGLEDGQFLLDFHFPRDLLVFSPRQLLANLFVHKAGHLVVQDKTSYFPVACLAAPPGSTVLDACAAPGMKTVHIAAKMNNHGTVFALDINARGFSRLECNLNTLGVQCCQPSYLNFLSIDPSQEPFGSAEYILLDVPCSHTGNRSQGMQAAGVDNVYTPDRLKGISALQYKMLCHALKFPKVKRIVYTTTSTEEQENEKVIQDALGKNPEKFKLVRAFPEWHIRGSPDFAFGEFCVRTKPHEDLTIGSFTAVLERIKDGPQRVESFTKKFTDVVGKLPLEPFVDRVGNRRDDSVGNTKPSVIQKEKKTFGHEKRAKVTDEESSMPTQDSCDQDLAPLDRDLEFCEETTEKKKKRKRERRSSKADKAEGKYAEGNTGAEDSSAVVHGEDKKLAKKRPRERDRQSAETREGESPGEMQGGAEDVEIKKHKKKRNVVSLTDDDVETPKPSKKKVKEVAAASTGGINIFSVPKKTRRE